MAQQLKALCTKPDNLEFNPWAYMVEQGIQHLQVCKLTADLHLYTVPATHVLPDTKYI